MQKDILAILKKHVEDGIIETTPKKVSKLQIHNFGESMKGINEFIGAMQMLSLNLNKIKALSEKIDWINDILKEGDKEDAMLSSQRDSHLAGIKEICENASFIGIKLFDTQIACVASGIDFSINVENPLNDISSITWYCNERLEEIDALTSRLNNTLNSIDEGVESIDYDDIFKSNPFAKMYK